MFGEPIAQRKALYALLGDLPERQRPISARVVNKRDFDGYWIETLDLDLNGIERVPAFFVYPKGQVRNAPAVLYNHAHGGNYVLGKEEFIHGRDSLQDPPYAKVLTEMGYCGLCLDAWNFGERRGRSESALFKELLWKGQVLWGLMVYDSLRALDYLCTRPEVDGKRFATLGLSMGSTMAWWVAALDERVRVCVDICCLTDFEELIHSRGLDGHGIYYYVPGLLKQFDTASINALIAPRAHLSLAGNFDSLTPPRGLDKIDAALQEVYAVHGVAENWRMVRYGTGHFETACGRAEILSFLQAHLG